MHSDDTGVCAHACVCVCAFVRACVRACMSVIVVYVFGRGGGRDRVGGVYCGLAVPILKCTQLRTNNRSFHNFVLYSRRLIAEQLVT